MLSPIRPSSALLSVLASSARSTPRVSWAQIRNARAPEVRRWAHHVPKLLHDDSWQSEGVAGLLSPAGYDQAWTQYQGLMVKRLNDRTAGLPEEDKSAKELLVEYSRDPAYAALFNYASMAHNNHFFFESLLMGREGRMTDGLRDLLESSFGSIETMRSEILNTASAMFGPGFVWLVCDTDFRTYRHPITLRILTTYLAGSPYAEAHMRQQPIDMNTENEYSDTLRRTAARERQEQQIKLALKDARLKSAPLLCVNTWEHVWVGDYGVAGKRAFLNAWWSKIDWNVVQGRVPKIPSIKLSR